jgi:hypothetical protein
MREATHWRRAWLSLLILALGSCATSRETMPARTATEQLEISAAADRAAEQMTLPIPPGTKVFVDAGDFEGYDSKYAIGAIKNRLLSAGGHLVGKAESADVVVEIRAGALSVDEHELLIGIPSFQLPIPLATTALTFPEIALYKWEDRRGIAKFAVTAYDAKDGTWRGSAGPDFGYSDRIRQVVLFFFSWGRQDLVPEDKKDRNDD